MVGCSFTNSGVVGVIPVAVPSIYTFGLINGVSLDLLYRLGSLAADFILNKNSVRKRLSLTLF